MSRAPTLTPSLLDRTVARGQRVIALVVGEGEGYVVGSGISPGELSGARTIFAAKSGAVRYGPHVKGPLPEGVANNFRGGSYMQTALQSETTLYRVYGGKAGEIAPWWSRTAPQGPLQAQMDLALKPQWGNTAQNVVQIRVPAGTTIYEGFAAPQGGLFGGGNQVFIPKVDPTWVVKP